MQILKHGNKVNERPTMATCCKCGCEFLFKNSDLLVNGDLACPECGNLVYEDEDDPVIIHADDVTVDSIRKDNLDTVKLNDEEKNRMIKEVIESIREQESEDPNQYHIAYCTTGDTMVIAICDENCEGTGDIIVNGIGSLCKFW